jgi:hypothetical protein
MVLMTPGKMMAEALTFLQVIQELDDFNLRCWFFLNTIGDPIFAATGRVSVVSEALQTKLLALVNVIPIAESQRISRVIFSTDCLVLKQAMESSTYDYSRLGPLLLHAKFLLSTSFHLFSFEFVPRPCNMPAHELAAVGARGELHS